MSEIGKEFIEKTKYRYLVQSDQMKGLPPPPLDLDYAGSKEVIDLPDPKCVTVKNVAVHEAIVKRRSVRQYSSEPLSIGELSFLLWCSQGVKEVVERYYSLRTVPSAGARHALETYILANNISDVQYGLYRFLPVEHRIIKEVTDTGISERIVEACFRQDFVKTSAATFIWTAVVYRMKWRYGERGYRYLFLDAGHACQNLYLAAESVDCGVCAIAAFSDDDVNAILDLDGVEQIVIYLATVGKKKSEKS